MTLLGIDVSHHQGAPNFGAVRAAGNSFAFIKATEGVGYTDPAFTANRAGAHGAGLTAGFYHFASAGDPVKEADYFCSVVGPLKPGDLVALDWETSAPNPPAWCKTWLDRVTAKLGVKPLIYMNQSTRDGFDWSPVASGNYGLWLAQYDGSPTVVPNPGRWPNVALKQYTSGGTVPGVAGLVDRNVFFGDATALAAYGYQPPGADMTPDELFNATFKAADGKSYTFATFIAMTNVNAFNAARDAAVARKLAEQAATGVVLTTAEIDAIAAQVAADLAAGYKINVIPPA